MNGIQLHVVIESIHDSPVDASRKTARMAVGTLALLVVLVLVGVQSPILSTGAVAMAVLNIVVAQARLISARALTASRIALEKAPEFQ